jgi:hypothetical protein
VAAALQLGHSQAGRSTRGRRSLSGFTLMLSNNGESVFMLEPLCGRRASVFKP